MIDRRIKFRHIQCFVEICRQKSLKKAAERQYLDPAGHLQDASRNWRIFSIPSCSIAAGRGVSPTKEGEVFLHFAEMSVASLQQGLQWGWSNSRRGGKTRLAVGALPSVAARLMPAGCQNPVRADI